MIAITGANGHLGKATMKCLLKKISGKNIIAIVRDPSKLSEFKDAGIIVRKADYEDIISLNEALKGIDTLLQISTTSMGERGIGQELNVVEAAKRQGIRHIVYTSGLKPDNEAHFLAVKQCLRTEQAILDSGMVYSILRNSLYMETIPLFMGNAVEEGGFYLSAGKGKVSFVSREDIAEALCTVLTGNGHQNRIYEITGSDSFGFDDIAALLSKNQAKRVAYVDVPEEVLREELLKSGMPEEEVGWFLSLIESIKHNEFAHVEDTLERLIQRKPQTLQDYLKR